MKETIEKKLLTPEYVKDIRSGKYANCMEEAVEAILKNCNIEKFPINMWRIARTLNFTIFDAKSKRKNISGVMFDGMHSPKIVESFGTKRFIILNREKTKEMQMFTLAHEIGHFVLHCNDETEFLEAYHGYRNKDSESMDSYIKKSEKEADQFATELLMPTRLFKDYICSSNNRYDKKLLAREMSIVCVVEEDAIYKRLEKLKILV